MPTITALSGRTFGRMLNEVPQLLAIMIVILGLAALVLLLEIAVTVPNHSKAHLGLTRLDIHLQS